MVKSVYFRVFYSFQWLTNLPPSIGGLVTDDTRRNIITAPLTIPDIPIRRMKSNAIISIQDIYMYSVTGGSLFTCICHYSEAFRFKRLALELIRIVLSINIPLSSRSYDFYHFTTGQRDVYYIEPKLYDMVMNEIKKIEIDFNSEVSQEMMNTIIIQRSILDDHGKPYTGNHRLISVLDTIVQIYERIVKGRVESQVCVRNKHNISGIFPSYSLGLVDDPDEIFEVIGQRKGSLPKQLINEFFCFLGCPILALYFDSKYQFKVMPHSTVANEITATNNLSNHNETDPSIFNTPRTSAIRHCSIVNKLPGTNKYYRDLTSHIPQFLNPVDIFRGIMNSSGFQSNVLIRLLPYYPEDGDSSLEIQKALDTYDPSLLVKAIEPRTTLLTIYCFSPEIDNTKAVENSRVDTIHCGTIEQFLQFGGTPTIFRTGTHTTPEGVSAWRGINTLSYLFAFFASVSHYSPDMLFVDPLFYNCGIFDRMLMFHQGIKIIYIAFDPMKGASSPSRPTWDTSYDAMSRISRKALRIDSFYNEHIEKSLRISQQCSLYSIAEILSPLGYVLHHVEFIFSVFVLTAIFPETEETAGISIEEIFNEGYTSHPMSHM